jgi:hypothetical protein
LYGDIERQVLFLRTTFGAFPHDILIRAGHLVSRNLINPKATATLRLSIKHPSASYDFCSATITKAFPRRKFTLVSLATKYGPTPELLSGSEQS